MNDKLPPIVGRVATEKRILNEFESKILNEEKLEHVITSRRGNRLSDFSEMLFQCECDDKACTATITISTEEYAGVHHKTKDFIVIPSHVRLDLEEVVNTFTTYVLVTKFFPNKGAADGQT